MSKAQTDTVTKKDIVNAICEALRAASKKDLKALFGDDLQAIAEQLNNAKRAARLVNNLFKDKEYVPAVGFFDYMTDDGIYKQKAVGIVGTPGQLTKDNIKPFFLLNAPGMISDAGLKQIGGIFVFDENCNFYVAYCNPAY